jgi:hypothetical protein
MRKVIVMFLGLNILLLQFFTLRAECKIKEDSSADGKKCFWLENNFLRIRISPELGGQCTGVVIKKNGKEIEDFTVNLFDDMDWSKSYQDQVFSKVPYACKILKNTKEQAQIQVEARGAKDYSFFIIRKTFTLNAGESRLKTDYEIHNLAESMGTYSFKLWCHNGLFAKNLKANYYWSSPRGIHCMSYPGKMSNWEYQSPRAWTGIISEPANSGMACVMNYPEVITLYNWFGSHSANMEWRYMPVKIKNGDSFFTTIWTVPFIGLDRIDYASKHGAFAIDVNDSGDAVLNFAPANSGSYNLIVEFKNTVDKKWNEKINKKISVLTADNIKIPISLTDIKKGRYVFRVTISGNNKKDIFERVFSIGGAEDKGEYVYKPVEKKNSYVKEKKYFPYKLSQDFITKHVKWFKPLYNGKIKVLFIKDWMMARPVVELAERFDLDFDMPALMKSGYCFSGFVPPRSENISSHVDAKPYLKALEALVEKNEYDVIIVDRAPAWNDLTPKTRELILEKYKSGTPLMLASNQARDNKDLKALMEGSIMPKGMPKYKRKELKTDSGVIRAVRFPDNHGHCFLTHDFAQNLLWVSGKDSKVKLDVKLPAKAKLNQDELADKGIDLTFNLPEAMGLVQIEKVLTQKVTREKIDIVSSQLQDVKSEKGENKITMSFPYLLADNYQLSVILRKNGKVINSAVKDIDVTSSLEITDIKLDENIFKKGEKIDGEVSFVNKSKKIIDGKGFIEFYDNWGRVLGKKMFGFKSNPDAGLNEKFSFKQENPLSVIHNIRCTLSFNKNDIVSKNVEITYPEFNYSNDDYLGFTWGAPGNCWGRSYAIDILRDYCGFNLLQSANGRLSSLHNQKFYHDRLLVDAYNDWQNCKTPGIRKYCLTEQKTIDYVAKRVDKAADDTYKYGGFALNMGDEASLTHWESPSEVCYSPSSMKIFYNWIKEKYKTLDNLNKEWGTSFKTWESVKPMTEAEAKDRHNLAPWSDFREHMENVWTGFMKKMKDIKDKKCPKAMFSICGVQGGHPYSGYNWWKLRDVFDFVMPYTSTAVLRSFNPKGKYGTYTGYRIDPVQQDKDSWRFFFDGQFVFSYFLSTYPVLPDLSISHIYADPIRKNMKRFGEGIGKLFIDTKRKSDKIAIHYSQPSIRINYMLKYREKAINNFIKFYRDSRADYENIFKDLGYDPLYISYEQIENGELTPEKWAMFVLPISTALSAKEVKAIKQYVKDGGIVVADCLTGLYGENGKPNSEGSLDELFGIKRQDLKKNRLAYSKNQISGLNKPLLFCNEAGISANGAEILFKRSNKVEEKVGEYTLSEPAPGGGLAWLNKYGKGKTVYLGFVSDYVKNPLQVSATSGLYRKVLNSVGFKEAEIKVSYDDNTYGLYQVLRHQFEGDENLFFGLIRRDTLKSDNKNIKVGLPSEYHIYDMLNKKYIGFGNNFKTKQVSGIGYLYSALKYKVEKIDINGPAKVKVGTNALIEMKVVADDKKIGYHVLRFKVFNPKGVEEKCYTINLSAPNGKASKTLPIALNAVPGKWKISVEDISSGVKSDKSFEVVR